MWDFDGLAGVFYERLVVVGTAVLEEGAGSPTPQVPPLASPALGGATSTLEKRAYSVVPYSAKVNILVVEGLQIAQHHP